MSCYGGPQNLEKRRQSVALWDGEREKGDILVSALFLNILIYSNWKKKKIPKMNLFCAWLCTIGNWLCFLHFNPWSCFLALPWWGTVVREQLSGPMADCQGHPIAKLHMNSTGLNLGKYHLISESKLNNEFKNCELMKTISQLIFLIIIQIKKD